jgi:hypothetical protein
MEPMTTDELLQRWSDGSITADELRELTAKLAEPQHQSALLNDWLLESTLPDRLPGASVAAFPEAQRTTGLLKAAEKPQTRKGTGWLSWRPLAAAAAGIVLGIFCTSAVFGYSSLRKERRLVLPVVDGSFEAMQVPVKAGFPAVAGLWQGDEGIRESRADAPDGAHALRLNPVKSGARQFSYVHQIVPVDAAGRLELSTAFHVGGDARQRAIARITSYDVPADQVRSLAPHLLEDATSSAQRAITFEGNGWQKVHLSLQLPPGTRCVVIALGTRTLNAISQPCFVDAVEAALFVPEP